MSTYGVVFGKGIKGEGTAGGLAGEQQLGKSRSVQTAALENPGGFCTSNPHLQPRGPFCSPTNPQQRSCAFATQPGPNGRFTRIRTINLGPTFLSPDFEICPDCLFLLCLTEL